MVARLFLLGFVSMVLASCGSSCPTGSVSNGAGACMVSSYGGTSSYGTNSGYNNNGYNTYSSGSGYSTPQYGYSSGNSGYSSGTYGGY